MSGAMVLLLLEATLSNSGSNQKTITIAQNLTIPIFLLELAGLARTPEH